MYLLNLGEMNKLRQYIFNNLYLLKESIELSYPDSNIEHRYIKEKDMYRIYINSSFIGSYKTLKVPNEPIKIDDYNEYCL